MYTQLLHNLSELKLREKHLRDKVQERSSELSTVSEELEGVKRQMDELGQTMTNAAPLQWIKTAVQNLKVSLFKRKGRVMFLKSYDSFATCP